MQTTLLSTDHPGGNVVIEREEPGHLWLSPDFRHMQEGHKWFYWSFRAHNRTPLRVTFSHRNYIAAHGPAVSRDGGVTWQWLGREHVTQEQIGEHDFEFSFDIPPVAEGENVHYAVCPQYQEHHLQRWLRRHEGNPYLSVSELCRSRKGRAVELVRIGSGQPRPIIMLLSRNHSCEATATYTLEGFLEAALGDDETGKALRANYEIVAIPFVDKDGVEEGDQGKLRHPHDHNRDYNDEPIYPEVAAIMAFGKAHRESIVTFFDLHCPMVHGYWDNCFYIVGSAVPQVAADQDAFADIFHRKASGPIPLHTPGVLHFGEAWNTGANYHLGKSAACWASGFLTAAKAIGSFEVPYANSSGVEINAESTRALGRDLAVALVEHLS